MADTTGNYNYDVLMKKFRGLAGIRGSREEFINLFLELLDGFDLAGNQEFAKVLGVMLCGHYYGYGDQAGPVVTSVDFATELVGLQVSNGSMVTINYPVDANSAVAFLFNGTWRYLQAV